MAAQLAELAVFGLPDSYLTDYTAQDRRGHARTTSAGWRASTSTRRTLTIVVVGDKKTLAEPLAKLAPVELRDLDGDPIADPK